jgi:hypothetical protein
MPTRSTRSCAPQLVFLAVLLTVASASGKEQNADQAKTAPQNAGQPTAPPTPGADYSGMYTFLRDGEFVQITIDAPGHVIGFVSRYGDSDSDRDVFLDHFFKLAKLEGDRLTFTTETVHGKSFEFHGTIERGEGKTRGDEAFYLLKGTLTENATDNANKTSSQSHQVALKSFPQDMAPPPSDKQ